MSFAGQIFGSPSGLFKLYLFSKILLAGMRVVVEYVQSVQTLTSTQMLLEIRKLRVGGG